MRIIDCKLRMAERGWHVGRLIWACAVILAGTIAPAAFAQDPFSLQNKRPESTKAETPAATKLADPKPQQQTANQLEKGAWRKLNDTAIDSRLDLKIAVTPQQVRRGQTVKVTVTGTPRPGFHTYPFTQRTSDPAQDESQLSTWTADDAGGQLRQRR